MACALIVLFLAAPVAAQDQGLDLLLFARSTEAAASSEVQVHGIQLYRLPLSFHLRNLDNHSWGLRVTFPLSLSSVRIEGASSLGNFVKKLGIAAVVPGLEVEIPLTERILLRPFGEAGIGKSGDSSTEVMYGVGVRASTFREIHGLHFNYGGSVAGRKTPALVGTFDKYGSFEGGIDAQMPLGFSIGDKAARAGPYVIGRLFNGLELQREGEAPVVLRRQVEAGVSFSTAPVLKVWKIPLPWLAAGYQFGHTVSGVRIYLKFPF